MERVVWAGTCWSSREACADEEWERDIITEAGKDDSDVEDADVGDENERVCRPMGFEGLERFASRRSPSRSHVEEPSPDEDSDRLVEGEDMEEAEEATGPEAGAENDEQGRGRE